VGTKLLLERLLHVFERVPAIEVLEDELLVFLEAEVTEADGVLDDVAGPALVVLGRYRHIRPEPDAHLLAPFAVVARIHETPKGND